jgi:putative ABC transport system permease protein
VTGGWPRAVNVAAWLVRRTLPRDSAEVFLGDLFEELSEHRRPWRFVRGALSIVVHAGVRSLNAGRNPRDHRKANVMESLLLDVRFALRSFRKRPAFAVVVLATLTLGIGASTAIFSAVEGVLIRPLPFRDPDRLVAANELDGTIRMSFAWPNFVDVRARAQAFEALTCHVASAFNVLGNGAARRVDGRYVCANFFDVLGVKMQAGRSFAPNDEAAGATAVMIVSDRFWRQDLGGDPSVIGRTLRTSEATFTIVGVLPASYRFSRAEDLFVTVGVALRPDSIWLDRGNHFGLGGLGRLKPGVTVSEADAELKLIAEDLKRAYPNTNARSSAEVAVLKDRMVNQVRGTLQALIGAVGFLLLLACVNVANLFVARGAARHHELAIRAALGGSRFRIVRQLLAESMLLALGGAVLGMIVAGWLLALLIALAPEGLPRIEEVALNRFSLLFALGAAAVSGILFGAFPAIQATSMRGTQSLTRASATLVAAPPRTRRVLMAVEVALALILLTGCGLMARTMLRLNSVDPGFDPDRLLTARIVLAGDQWDANQRLIAFHDQLIAAVRRLPGVADAALTLSLPIEGSNWGSIFTVRDKPAPPRTELPASAFVPVSSGYFKTMRIPVRRGREFTDADTAESRRLTIVNQTFANTMWPGEDPIGKFVKQGWPETPEADAPWREVIGVVSDVKLEGLDQAVPLQAYLPLRQEPSRSFAIVARTLVPPESLMQPLQAAVQSVDPDVPVTRVFSMAELMRTSIARQRLSTVILAVFAGVAILLAGVGLYGVVSHSVVERTREIGVRLALGAERGAVMRLFVLQGVATAAVGTLAGLAGAYYLSRWLSTLLFEVEPTDPTTYVSVVLLLLGVAAAACYIPARRASRVDPLLALRAD